MTCVDVINGTTVHRKIGVLVVAVGAGLSTPFAFATADQPTPHRTRPIRRGAFIDSRFNITILS